MAMHQTMSGRAAQIRIDASAQRYATWISDGTLTLAGAHQLLKDPDRAALDLFKIAGLAKAIACFQCSAE